MTRLETLRRYEASMSAAIIELDDAQALLSDLVDASDVATLDGVDSAGEHIIRAIARLGVEIEQVRREIRSKESA